MGVELFGRAVRAGSVLSRQAVPRGAAAAPPGRWYMNQISMQAGKKEQFPHSEASPLWNILLRRGVGIPVTTVV